MDENSYIAYTQTQNASTAPIMLLYTKDIAKATSMSGLNVPIGITGAELLKAISSGTIVFLLDSSSTNYEKDKHALFVFETYSYVLAQSRYEFVFRWEDTKYTFSNANGLNEELKLSKVG